MKNRIFSLLLAAVLSAGLLTPVLAAPADEAEQAAWTLYHYGLFQGVSTDSRGFPDFALEEKPTRAQGVTMLVRLLGKESAALNGSWTTPFNDVPGWAKPYVGYAYENGLTNGVSATEFSPAAPIRATEYLTLVLRSMGYVSGEDFDWDRAWVLSNKLEITGGEYKSLDAPFDRGDVAWISLRALDAKKKSSAFGTLRQDLDLPRAEDLCVWEETCQSCLEGQMVFSIAPASDSPRTCLKFTVDNAWANGQPCRIKQFSTKTELTGHLKSFPKDVRDDVGSDPFALVYLNYDEAAVLAAAEKTVEAGGKTCPVIRFQLEVTLSLAAEPDRHEKAEMEYYILGYWGEEFDKH